jgi:NitT/TauT family transport system permease protein
MNAPGASDARPADRRTAAWLGLPDVARIVLWNLLAVAVALLLWHALAAAVGSKFFPGPLKIVDAFMRLATRGDTFGHSLITHSWASLHRVLVGFGIGLAFGIPLGLLMGLYPRLYAATRAVLEPFRFIPPIAWIPLAIIFFSGLTRFAFLIFLGAFFPVFTATAVGVARVEPIHRKVAMVYGASKRWILFHVVIPTVLPDIMGGMRVALGTAWLTIVAAELAGGISTGLGRMMMNYAELVQIPEIVVGMVLIGAIGFVMNEAVLLIEKRLFRWRWQVSL